MAEAEVQAKEADWKAINEHVREIRRVRVELNTLCGQETAQEEVCQGYESEVQKAEEGVSKAKESLNEVRQQKEKSENKVKCAQDRIESVRIRRNTADLVDKLEQLKKLSGKRGSLEAQLQDLQAPSDNEMKKLLCLHDEVREAHARLEVAALQIYFEPQMQIEGTVTRDGKREQFTFAPGEDEALEWQAAQAFELEMSEIGHLSVLSGSGEVRDLKADLEEKEQKFHLAIAPFGGVDLSELADRNTQANSLKVEIHQIRFQEETLAPEGSGALRKKQNTLEAQQKQILETYPELEDEKPSEEEASEVQKKSEQGLVEVSREVQSAEQQLEAARKILREMEDKRGRAREELTKTCTKIEQQESREDELIADGLSDVQRQKALSEALDKFDQAKQRLNQIPPVENLEELENTEKRWHKVVEELDGRLRNIENNLNQKRGELRRAEAEGLYSRLAEAEERVTILEQKYQSASMRANSIKLLRDTILECRRETVENLVAPVNQRVSRAFQRLVGERYGEIQFNEEFLPETIAVQARDTQVEPNLLSHGTQEQLNILVRMTLGEILAEGEGQKQLVVLDDPLAHTDPGRHHLMLELLYETAEQLQLIILTCRTAAYAGLGAKSFDLEELKRSYARDYRK